MKLKNVLAFVMSMALVVPMVTTNLPVENTTVVSAEDEYNKYATENGYLNMDYWDFDNVNNTEDGYMYMVSQDGNEACILNYYPDFENLILGNLEADVTSGYELTYFSNVVDLVIPSEVNGLKVTSMSLYAPYYGENYYWIDGDKYKYDDSFDDYEANFIYPYLETVQIPETMKYIDSSVFHVYDTTPYDSNNEDSDSSLKEVTILSKDVQIQDGFLCNYEYDSETYEVTYTARDITLIGYVGSTTEEYAKKYGFKFVDVTTVKTSNNDNNNNPTVGDSNKNTNTNNNNSTNSSSENKKSDSPATSDNGVMPLITLGTLVGASALITKKKKD